MGQKSNTLTLRSKIHPNFSFLNVDKHNHIFFRGCKYLTFLERFLNLKNIITVSKRLNFTNNTYFLGLILFFRTSKLTSYRKKTIKFNSKANKSNAQTFFFKKKNSLTNIFLSETQLPKLNSTVVTLKSVNNLIDSKILAEYYQKTSRFIGVLFSRKFSLYIDFLKLSVLFNQKLISASVLLNVLGQVFRVLPKRKHTRFLYLLKYIFNMYLTEINSKNTSNQKSIKGIKFIVNGKLQGKTRASTSCIQIGAVPIQSLNKDIEFAKLHVHTLYGVFGFKVWVHRM